MITDETFLSLIDQLKEIRARLQSAEEALESEVDHLHSEGYGHDATSRSRKVLKKFQEWK